MENLSVSEIKSVIAKAEILIEALPYIQSLAGKTVVIKYGGNAMINEELKNHVMEDITLLKYIGINPVLVHGGGPDINAMLDRLGIVSSFSGGLRVTDAQTMSVAQMVLVGKTNKEIVARLNQNGAKAIGICGIDGRLIECEKITSDHAGKPLDIGFVGNIVRINTRVLEMLATDEYIPVVAPIGIGPNGESYNINADTVAAALASAMRAEKVIFLTDVGGLLADVEDEGSVISECTAAEVEDMIDSGAVSKGMIPKLEAVLESVRGGVTAAHIIDGRIAHSVLLEIMTDDAGLGTKIVPNGASDDE